MNKEELKEYERKSYGMENIHKMLLVAMDRLDKYVKKIISSIHYMEDVCWGLKGTINLFPGMMILIFQ